MAGQASIDSVAFYCNSSTYYFGSYNDSYILASHTGLNQFTSNFEDNYGGNIPETVLYRSTLDLVWNYKEWNVIEFDSGFGYNGTDNLILEFSFVGNDGNSLYNRGWYPEGGNRVLDGYPGYETGELRSYMNALRVYYTPDQPDVSFEFINPPTFVYQGGTLNVTVRGENNTAGPLSFDAWFEASGIVTVTVAEYPGLTLAGGQVIQANLGFSVPPTAPPGDWTLSGYVGELPATVWDSDSFNFEILPSLD